MTATIDQLREKQAALKAKLREADRLLKGNPSRSPDRAEAHRSCRRARLAAARADTVAWLTGTGG